MNNKIKDMMDLTEREEEVTKREKELDEHLKKKSKKRFWKKQVLYVNLNTHTLIFMFILR